MAIKVVIPKRKLKGNWVPRLIGRRVSNRGIRFQKPNMQKVTINGITYIASAKDIKSIKRKIREAQEAATVQQ